MKHEQLFMWMRIALAVALVALCLFIPLPPLLSRFGFAMAYIIVGGDVLWEAFRHICRLQMLDEKFLMSVASLGAFAVGQYTEAVAVMLLYQIGERFQDYAVDRSRRSVAALMDVTPPFARVLKDGVWVETDPATVEIGSLLRVKVGERIPIDGVVTEGASNLDTKALTGESLPRPAGEGDEVLAGCISLTGMLTVRTTKAYADSTVSRILEMVENAVEHKAKSENYVTAFARVYTPAVVGAACLLAVVAPLLFDGGWNLWLYRALTFLVVSCPCALVISVPLAFFSGIGAASAAGVLIKGSNYMQTLAKVKTLATDKTGTLTEGRFTVTDVCPVSLTADELLRYAAAAETGSNHPIANVIVSAVPVLPTDIRDAAELAGLGVQATVDGRLVLAGNPCLMASRDIVLPTPLPSGTVVYVAVDGAYAGYIRVEDRIKPHSAAAVKDLHALGIRCVMLSGDTPSAVHHTAQAVGIAEGYGALLPDKKIERIESLLQSGTTAFVGDGINDAPVLARADVGIAMGGLGSDAAIEAADVVLMQDDPAQLPLIIRLSRRTCRVVWQNIVLALGVKAVVLFLGATGLTGMWEAIFADVGVSILAILNAMRLLMTKTEKNS